MKVKKPVIAYYIYSVLRVLLKEMVRNCSVCPFCWSWS